MDTIIKYIEEKHPNCTYTIKSNIIFVYSSTGIIHYDLNYLRYILK